MQDEGGKVPRLLVQLREAILSECTQTEGIFRRTSNVCEAVRYGRSPALIFIVPTFDTADFTPRLARQRAANTALERHRSGGSIITGKDPTQILRRTDGPDNTTGAIHDPADKY